jgi:hypothetical protein
MVRGGAVPVGVPVSVLSCGWSPLLHAADASSRQSAVHVRLKSIRARLAVCLRKAGCILKSSSAQAEITRAFYTTSAAKDKRRGKLIGARRLPVGVGFGRVLVCVLSIFRERRVLGGHTVFLVGPLAKVYELASFGTERAVGIILPLGGLTTGWTLHRKKLERFEREIGCTATARPNMRPFNL